MKRTKYGGMTANEIAQSIVSARAALQQTMGYSYSGERDIYSALGYKRKLVFEDYYAIFSRNGVGNRVITAFPDAVWTNDIKVIGKTKKFNKAWDSIVKKNKIFHYLNRADTLSGIGHYGILLLGVNDGRKLSEPIGKATNLLYVQPYMEKNVKILEIETSTKSPKYGKPKMYEVNTKNFVDGKSDQGEKKIKVHASRVIHIAENLQENDILGTPRLEPVFNALSDLEKISGGSGEMFWRGGFPGYGFLADPEAEVDTEKLKEELDSYVHGMQRYLKLQGFDVKQFMPQIADPKNHFSIVISIISGATGIPQRILIGSERGELASSQDETNWLARVDERQTDYCEPMILDPFIDKLMDVKILPFDEYTTSWNDKGMLLRNIEASGKIMEAVKKYLETPDAINILPPDIFFGYMLNFSVDKVKMIEDYINKNLQFMDNGIIEDINDVPTDNK